MALIIFFTSIVLLFSLKTARRRVFPAEKSLSSNDESAQLLEPLSLGYPSNPFQSAMLLVIHAINPEKISNSIHGVFLRNAECNNNTQS
jgi:hypothetical protein